MKWSLVNYKSDFNSCHLLLILKDLEQSEIEVTEDYVQRLITEINDNISEFDQKLVYQKLDLLDAEFIVFISTHSNDIDK